METSCDAKVNPKIKKENHRNGRLKSIPIKGNAIPRARVEAKTTGELPRLAACRPAGPRAVRTPIELKKSELPRTELER